MALIYSNGDLIEYCDECGIVHDEPENTEMSIREESEWL